MKKFVITVAILVVLYMGWDYAYYRLGWYIDFHPDRAVSTFMTVEDEKIYQTGADGKKKEFQIRGVNLGSGEPGQWSTDFDIDKETYKRWFAQIQAMGANTIRVYTIQSDDFYNAFYEYNHGRKEPLYLLHGVWVNDYVQYSHCDAYDDEFLQTLLIDCRTVVDVIHGNKKVSLGRKASAGSGTYKHDISPWVIGYILGVEWEDVTVAYTDEKYKNTPGYTSYKGTYMQTTEDASPFEAMLAQVGDKIIEYESERYKAQRLVAFSNWPTTDPFEYPIEVNERIAKCAAVDVEHIKTTDAFLAGQFASYHVYPYFPAYLQHIEDWSAFGIDKKDYDLPKQGTYNHYRAYMQMLSNHHTMPVIISEFGVSTGRGMAHRDENTNRNQGNMSEKEQGDALIACWEDLMAADCQGGCIFSWQDEWFKRTWNTMYAVDLKRTPYWSDYQTNEQYFGLLSFDPGKERSVCYVDGDVSEWNDKDIVTEQNGVSLSMKSDEKFIYFRIHKDGLKFGEEPLYIPIDTTQKTGSNYCEKYKLRFDRAADFLLVLKDKTDSRLLVQERYEALRANYSDDVYGYNTYLVENIPEADSPLFKPIDMIWQYRVRLDHHLWSSAKTFETGKLTYGDANPAHKAFNSLADFIVKGDDIEVKLPWQLLNFSDPSEREIHDDYYDDNYGVAYQVIHRMYVGVGNGEGKERIALAPYELHKWGDKVTYHERLKSSYYIMKDYWNAS